MNNVQMSYDQIKKFNLVAGNLENTNHEGTLNGVASQLEFIKSELDEAFQGFSEGNAVELLDGAVDVFVTACGLLQRLEAAGFDVATAMELVDANNISKFVKTAVYNNNKTMRPENTLAIETIYGYVVFKRESDGKVMKPLNYTPVNLSNCVPEDFFGSVEAGE